MMKLFENVRFCIFDIDYTIVGHDKEEEVLKCSQAIGINDDEFERFHDEYFSFWKNFSSITTLPITKDLLKQVMIDNIKILADKNIPLNSLLDTMLLNHGSYLYDDTVVILEYLTSKGYTLYCLTDWFKEEQCSTLKQFNVLHYFKDVFGFDNTYVKPSNTCIETLLHFPSDNFVVIGDSLSKDVGTANKYGLKSILIGSDCSEDNSERPTTIVKTLKDIMDVL